MVELMTQVPSPYQYLNSAITPKMIVAAVSLHGTIEGPGNADNPNIIKWAKEAGVHLGVDYEHDSIPWCGLFMTVVALRSGYPVPDISIRAKSWANFGIQSTRPMFGDVLVFERDQGGHVALYVGEDKQNFHVLGGNQHDCVCVTKIDKVRMVTSRRPRYIVTPANVQPVILSSDGKPVSTNEA
jgi:uncharacterized protein (TIGR02594 family)